MSSSWEARWYPTSPGQPGDVLSVPLALASGLYGAAVALRGAAFHRGLLTRTRVEGVHVISVGNLNVGGAGKTPVVIHLAQRLAQAGRKVAVVTRGYGRASHEELLLRSGGPWPTAAQAGDEPLLIARRCPSAAVFVGARRAGLVGRAREELHVDAVLLDDGFQHRRVHRDVDIVVVDEAVGFGNGRLLPRGPLREPPSALSRATLIWLRLSEDERRAVLPRFEVPVVRAFHRAVGLRDPMGAAQPLEALRGREVLALSGIARPSSFERTLLSLGARVRMHHAFKDHEVFAPAQLASLRARALSEGLELVTTEKDAVRLPADFSAWVVCLDVVVVDGERALMEALGAPLRP